MNAKELNEWLAVIRFIREVIVFCEELDGTAPLDREYVAKRAKDIRSQAARYIK